ncbi:uncharacterized protein [Paramisgurnus dabryanus]|uniref:uncharacterized protein n=1 Tax=Paramisgurnus dabryanus TaxID=90735 RepID=UPI0031F3F632
MERSRVTVSALIYVLLFSQTIIYGAEVEMKVRPGDNITLHCYCPVTHFNIAWIRNCSHEHQPSLIIKYLTILEEKIPRFSFPPNINSFDLHITNITVSDLGLYYCAEYEKKINDDTSYYYCGNQTTRLSLAVSSGPFTTVSPPPPISDCFLHRTLLVGVCVVCFLLCFICVYCLCQRKTTGYESAKMLTVNVMKMDSTEKHQCDVSKTGKFCHHSEVTYRLLPSVHNYEKM